MATLADFTARSIDGTERKLSDFSGKVCLVVNVALNLLLLPVWGIVGAGIALLASYLVVVALSAARAGA